MWESQDCMIGLQTHPTWLVTLLAGGGMVPQRSSPQRLKITGYPPGCGHGATARERKCLRPIIVPTGCQPTRSRKRKWPRSDSGPHCSLKNGSTLSRNDMHRDHKVSVARDAECGDVGVADAGIMHNCSVLGDSNILLVTDWGSQKHIFWLGRAWSDDGNDRLDRRGRGKLRELREVKVCSGAERHGGTSTVQRGYYLTRLGQSSGS